MSEDKELHQTPETTEANNTPSTAAAAAPDRPAPSSLPAPAIVDMPGLCSTPYELLFSDTFRRVVELYNRDRKKNEIPDNLNFHDLIIRQGESGEPVFTELHDFWNEKILPRVTTVSEDSHTIESRELTNRQHSRLNSLILQTFARLVKKLGEQGRYSIKRLPEFEIIARDLISNGYVPVIIHPDGNPFGEPVYPADANPSPYSSKLAEKSAEDGKDSESYIKIVRLPVMEDRSKMALNNPILPNPTVELSNFILPADPQKVMQMAEKNELGFSHEAGICSHMSLAVCRPGKESSTGKENSLGKEDAPSKDYPKEDWSDPVCIPNARFASHPLEQIRQYGSGLFEGIGVEKNEDGKINIFRLRDHWKRMSLGGQFFRMPPIPFEVFEKMVIDTVRANAAYIPVAGKGRLYIRPNWFDCGPKMHVGNSGNFMLLMTAVPIGSAQSYYKKKPAEKNASPKNACAKNSQQDEGITMFLPYNAHRAVTNGPGQTKADGNYGATIPHIEAAAQNGIQGVMYMNESGDRIEETNASSLIFLQLLNGQKTSCGKQKYRLITPSLKHGTILDSITRKTTLELAEKELGWEVQERDLSPEELIELLEKKQDGGIVHMFSAGTGAVLTPVHHIHRGWINMKDQNNAHGEPVRTFDIDKKDGRITGHHYSIGEYNSENPYGEAGQDLLKLLLDAKSGRLQARYPNNETYKSWLTTV